VVAETPLLPLKYGPWLNEVESLAPSGPEARGPRLEHPVAGLDPKSARSASLVDGELMTQCNHLELQREPPAERGGKEVTQGRPKCSHVEFALSRLQGTMAVRTAVSKTGDVVPASDEKLRWNRRVRVFGTHRYVIGL
jgi:hypothetical protein